MVKVLVFRKLRKEGGVWILLVEECQGERQGAQYLAALSLTPFCTSKRAYCFRKIGTRPLGENIRDIERGCGLWTKCVDRRQYCRINLKRGMPHVLLELNDYDSTI